MPCGQVPLIRIIRLVRVGEDKNDSLLIILELTNGPGPLAFHSDTLGATPSYRHRIHVKGVLKGCTSGGMSLIDLGLEACVPSGSLMNH